ncbi:MAG: gene transfer agent family protein [Anaerolineaceae bacterium]|nr:MAG: gene transfer agent family protein [Anaerolineaceae bacterium]
MRITEDWGNGAYSFRLGWGEWQELDTLLQVGPQELYERLLRGKAHYNWPREIIRCGLVGAGMDPGQALKLVRLYCEQREILDNTAIALKIVQAALFTPENAKDDHPGEAEATAMNSAASTSPSPSGTLQ